MNPHIHLFHLAGAATTSPTLTHSPHQAQNSLTIGSNVGMGAPLSVLRAANGHPKPTWPFR